MVHYTHVFASYKIATRAVIALRYQRSHYKLDARTKTTFKAFQSGRVR
ncbi:MAG: hypothetical protein F6K10_12860 [Moorea sp. SIO2B7]|nr:hypothetical protein [Moorena sp. SIO2B7]